MSTELQPVPLSGLAAYQDKQIVPCVEATLVSLFKLETEKKNGGGPLPYPYREGVLQEGNLQFRIRFDQKCNVQDELRGKRIRITCSTGRGMTGIKMDRYSKDEKWHHLNVTSSATIEVVGGQSSAPAQPARQSQSAPPTSDSSGAAYGDDPADAFAHIPYEARAAEWVRGFRAVCEAVGHDPDTELEALNHSDLKEITTGLFMSTRGKFGSYRPTLFQGDTSQVTEKMETLLGKAREASREEEADSSQTAGSTSGDWRAFQYENKGVIYTLGEKSDADISKLHAYLTDPKNSKVLQNPQYAELASHVAVAVAELENGYRKDGATDDLP